MKQKNKSIILYGNINDVCNYLKKYSKDFLYIKDLIEYYGNEYSFNDISKGKYTTSIIEAETIGIIQ